MQANFTLTIQLMGSLCTALSVVSIALGYFKLKSSHIFLMQKSSNDAVERFQYFQRDNTDNTHVKNEAMQTYIIEEKKRRYDFVGRHQVSALVVIFISQIGYLAVFNALHNYYRAVLLFVGLTAEGVNYTQTLMMGVRLFGCIVGFFVLDRISKKIQYALSAIIISVLLLIFGTLLQIYRNIYFWTPMVFLIPLEFFLGVGLSPITDILKGELFPLKEKPVLIATTIFFEELLSILCIIFLNTWIFSLGSAPKNLSFVFGVTTLVCGVAIILLLKDSRKQNLETVANLYSVK